MFSNGMTPVINEFLTRGWLRLRSIRRFNRWLSMATISGLTVLLLVVSQTWVGATASGNIWQNASFPVENFQAYTSAFGYRASPYGGEQQFHRGLDMAAPQGSYIRNWWAGKVVEVSDDSACGTSVVIESGQWEHIYCHMQGHVERDSSGRLAMVDRGGDVKIQEGQILTAGSRIGRIGMTGRTTGPHLHWGLKYSGKWVDPALVLRAMYAQQSNQQISNR